MPTLKLKQHKCVGCGFQWATASRYSRKYCSRECWQKNGAGKHLRTGKVVSCKSCSAPFYLRGSYVKVGRKYCSQRCRIKDKERQFKICNVCAAVFKPKSVKQGTCSYECSKWADRNPKWKGGTRSTGNRRARGIYDAKNCDRCGSDRYVVRHHKDRNPLNNNCANIERLCTSCHLKEHRGKTLQDSAPAESEAV